MNRHDYSTIWDKDTVDIFVEGGVIVPKRQHVEFKKWLINVSKDADKIT